MFSTMTNPAFLKKSIHYYGRLYSILLFILQKVSLCLKREKDPPYREAFTLCLPSAVVCYGRRANFAVSTVLNFLF
jgi:hypothetical protein